MQDLTTGKESSVLLKFATPMLLGMIFQQLYNIVDTVIVGKFIGSQALAAVGSSFPIIFTLIALIIGIGSGGTIVIAQYFGAKKIDKVKRTIDTLFIFLFFASIIATFLGIKFSTPLFKLLQLPNELIAPANSYLHIYMMGMIVFFGYNGTSSILRGLGDSLTPLFFLIFSTILNIGLDLLFIIKFQWGIEGAAWATVLSQGVAFLTAIIYLNRNHKVIRFSILKVKFDRLIFIQVFKIGLPTGLQQTFVALGMMALSGIVNPFGTKVIAAYTAAGRIDGLAAMPAMTLSQALATFVGQNLGANKIERVRKGLIATMVMSSIYAITITLAVLIFGEYFMKLFTDDQAVIDYGFEYLLIVGIFYILFTTMFTYNGVLRGAGATLIPMFITLFSLWLIRIPIAYFLSDKIGETGIWWAIPIAWFFGTIGAYIYYKSGKWKDKTIIKQNIKIKKGVQ